MAYNWVQQDLDDLDEAIAKGILSVGHGAKRVQYRSLKEMLSLRDRMARALDNTPGKPAHFAAFNKGF
jgi:hypothetical protein